MADPQRSAAWPLLAGIKGSLGYIQLTVLTTEFQRDDFFYFITGAQSDHTGVGI